MNKKLAAFTLMEVTISMLIAGIAVAITFSTYRIISGSYLDYTRKQDKVSTFIQSDKLLKQDFAAARQIVRSADGLTLDLEGGLVTYQFKDDYMLRDQFSLRTDTFKMKITQLDFQFENHAAEESQFIDQFSCEVEVGEQLIPLRYHKIYSAQDLFQ